MRVSNIRKRSKKSVFNNSIKKRIKCLLDKRNYGTNITTLTNLLQQPVDVLVPVAPVAPVASEFVIPPQGTNNDLYS